MTLINCTRTFFFLSCFFSIKHGFYTTTSLVAFFPTDDLFCFFSYWTMKYACARAHYCRLGNSEQSKYYTNKSKTQSIFPVGRNLEKREKHQLRLTLLVKNFVVVNTCWSAAYSLPAVRRFWQASSKKYA